MTHGALFNGIGGFPLAAQWAGIETSWTCEIDQFCNTISKHHFPNTTQYENIYDLSKPPTVDIISGGFPCQPYSQAGKRLGKEDDRHLWPEMLRVISEVKPSYVVGENVYGIVTWDDGLVFNEVQTDLESIGYEVQPVILPACSVGALHRRDRVWFVAYSKHNRAGRREQQPQGEQKENGTTPNPNGERLQEGCGQFRQEYELFVNASDDTSRGFAASWSKTKRGSGNISKYDGVSERLDGISVSAWKRKSIKAYGNAIVPQVAYNLFTTIKHIDENFS